MFRKTMAYLAIFAIIYFCSDSYLKYCIAEQSKNQTPYRLAFASIGANLLESRIDCWATIKTDGSFGELDQILLRLLNHLDLPAQSNRFLHREEHDIITVEYNLILPDTQYFFLLQTDKTGNNSNILVTAVYREDERLWVLEGKLQQVHDFTVYYQYKAIIEARPDAMGQKELLEILFANLNAISSSNYNEGTMLSMAGHSRLVRCKPIIVSGRPINIQATIRISNENKTEVRIGTPLLLNDY